MIWNESAVPRILASGLILGVLALSGCDSAEVGSIKVPSGGRPSDADLGRPFGDAGTAPAKTPPKPKTPVGQSANPRL